MKITLISVFFCIFSFFLTPQVFAQEQANSLIGNYFTGKVEKVLEEKTIPNNLNEELYTQRVQIKRLDTKESVELNVGTEFQPLNTNQRLKKNTVVVLAEQTVTEGHTEIVIVDVYRANTIYWLVGGFFVLVIFVARWQGLMSIVGMIISLMTLMNFIIPQILAGQNPMLVSLIGATLIGALSIYLCHGWSVKSHIALFSIISVLAVVGVISQSSVRAAQVVGLGSEEAYFLQFGSTANVNLQGLLLGGIILGALGVLDDICVAQVGIVFELKSLKKDIEFTELYNRALHIGKDHVASLVNTLILAYAGANLPLFLLFTINKQVPVWVTLNSEVILEEVIRTITGSIGLVIAVPITTLIAVIVAQQLSERKLKSLDSSAHLHTHAHHTQKV